MNKKLFAMMMVPVIVVMGGTFAFSAWSGSANSFFDQSAATVSYTETVNFVATNAHVNPLTVNDGPTTWTPLTYTSSPFMVSQATGGAASVVSTYANVSNLVPGDWAEFNVTIYNGGTAILNTSNIEFASSSGLFFNGAGQQISSPQPISSLQPPITTAYLNSVVNDTAGLSYGANMMYLFNATTDSSTPGLLSPGQTVDYTVYAILPTDAASSFAGYSFSLEIMLPLSTIQ